MATRMEYNTGCVVPAPVRKPTYYSSDRFIETLAKDLLSIMKGPDCDKELQKLHLYTSRRDSRRDLYYDLIDIAHNEKAFDLGKYGLTQANLRSYFPNSLKDVQQRLASKPSTDIVDYRRLPLVEQLKMMSDEY